MPRQDTLFLMSSTVNPQTVSYTQTRRAVLSPRVIKILESADTSRKEVGVYFQPNIAALYAFKNRGVNFADFSVARKQMLYRDSYMFMQEYLLRERRGEEVQWEPHFMTHNGLELVIFAALDKKEIDYLSQRTDHVKAIAERDYSLANVDDNLMKDPRFQPLVPNDSLENDPRFQPI
jgi:hypothetical protein